MAIKLNTKQEVIKFVSSKDSAIDHQRSDYEQYIKTLDEKFLTYHEGQQPTYFMIKTIMNYQESSIIKQKQIQLNKNGEMNFNIAYIMDEVRMSIVDIVNPQGIPEESKIIFKKSPDGYIDEELFMALESEGIVTEIFNAKQNYLNKNKSTEILKKS